MCVVCDSVHVCVIDLFFQLWCSVNVLHWLLHTTMSVFFKKDSTKDSADLEEKVLEESVDPVIEYYTEYLPGAKPIALYKNTKFMTLDKINGGLLTDEEKKSIKESPTGYTFNLKDSGYLVVDVDIDGYFFNSTMDDPAKLIKLLNPAIQEFPDKIKIVEWALRNKRKKIESKSFSNIVFSTLFMTPYVLTPSKGFHFYFKNDITAEQLAEVFGRSDAKYVKCMDGFTDVVGIDVFVDNGCDDAHLVLPLSNVIIENKKYKVDQENNYRLINVSYSGLRYTELPDGKLCDFRKASDLLPWLRKYARKHVYEQRTESNGKYEDRGRVTGVNPMNKTKYIKCMIKDFKILAGECTVISTFASKPFNLYQLMAFIAFFPTDMHYDLLCGFLDNLHQKLSDNAKAQLLTYYYHLAADENKIQDLKHPRYFEAIMNKTFELDIENKYIFEHEKDKADNDSDEEEVIEDETVSDKSKDLEEIVTKISKKYPDIKKPNK